jgi:hypothetical protein
MNDKRMTHAPPPSPHLQHRTLLPITITDPADPMDLSSLSHALPRIRSPFFRCHRCNGDYVPEWYHTEQSLCFFCVRFRTPTTRYALLYETQWFFIQSGNDDSYRFYMTYINLLHRWADHFHLPHTLEEKRYEAYLWESITE